LRWLQSRRQLHLCLQRQLCSDQRRQRPLQLPTSVIVLVVATHRRLRYLHYYTSHYYTHSLLKHYVPSRSLRSSDSNLLSVPRVRSCFASHRSFAVAAPTIWNTLPLDIRNSPSKGLNFSPKMFGQSYFFTVYYLLFIVFFL